MIYLGIDPGASGGIGVLHTDERRNTISVEAHKMPETPHDIATLLGQFAGAEGVRASLERVSAMPKQGVSSTFKFGRSFGLLEGSLAACGVAYELVPPSVWQKSLNCLTKGDKNVSKAMAQRLFPSVKITHAVADALLLAEYTRRKL